MDKKPPSVFDGSLTVAELAENKSACELAAMGKQAIKDAGARFRQIAGLKPGCASIRTDAMIDEIIERLTCGESLTSICSDKSMPAPQTFWNWRDADKDLDDRVRKAQARGAHMLADIRMDIAQGGIFSTGDARRDELFIKTIDKNVAQRNRAEFGDRVQVDQSPVVVNLPDWAIRVSQTRPIAIEHQSDDLPEE